MNLFALQSYQIDEWWPAILPLIKRAEERQVEWNADLVRMRLLEAQAQFWGIEKEGNLVGAFVTTIEEGASGLMGRVWIAAGHLSDGLDYYREIIEPWFREKGCRYIVIDGRVGWKRILKDYENYTAQLIKRLDVLH